MRACVRVPKLSLYFSNEIDGYKAEIEHLGLFCTIPFSTSIMYDIDRFNPTMEAAINLFINHNRFAIRRMVLAYQVLV